MAAKAESTADLAVLDLEYTEGGSSPWFIDKGRQFVSELTGPPENANLFGELARDGSLGALVNFLDEDQPSVSKVSLVCYIILGFVLVAVFVILPLAACLCRRQMANIGLLIWLICELIFLVAAAILVLCLMSLISTWSALDDGLRNKAPLAYKWALALMHNYTRVATLQLKQVAPNSAATLDKAGYATLDSIQWLRGNITAWESTFSGYANLTEMVTGPLSFLRMVLLGIGVAVALAAALFACGAWSRRQKALAKGKRSPVFVALINLAGAIVLFSYVALTLPMVARWLPVCVLTDTYVCTPYREGNFKVLDDGVARLWPVSERPDPFCRLVPSQVISNCAAKNKSGIGSLAFCSAPKRNAVPGRFYVLEQQASSNDTPSNDTTGNGTAAVFKVRAGDCFYPYKVIDTEMTSVCPLCSDELVGHWAAMLISAVFGLMGAMAVGAIAVIFLAIPAKKAKLPKRKRRVIRRLRPKKGKKKGKKGKGKRSPARTPPKERTPPPQPPESPKPAPSPVQTPLSIELQVPVPVPVPLPVVERPLRRLRRSTRSLPPPFMTPPALAMAPPSHCPMASSSPCIPLAWMPPPMPGCLCVYGAAGSAMGCSPAMHSSHTKSRSRASRLSYTLPPTALSVVPSPRVITGTSCGSTGSVTENSPVVHSRPSRMTYRPTSSRL
ncbi:hypothetical protein HPB48_009259 [Haemaphysalis longicornis]|uniref:Uncharacterized protein n=1 Tax=Haemaphysalis longicornis TaxID=44386 RepID=A0A9J6GEK5_HAELO|nr:hypothetical protein HPB48_009259 [Haemaphysalis longicornis]